MVQMAPKPHAKIVVQLITSFQAQSASDTYVIFK